MHRITILLIALLTIASLSAADIKGTILSASDSTAVAGASCRLMADSSMVAAAVSEGDGSFTLKTALKRPLRLEISMTGYSPADIIIDDPARSVDLGALYLDSNLSLGEVTVSAERLIQSKGKTIVYPSSADLKASSTSLSLFQKLPLAGVLADPVTRTLSVDGGSPLILIDGVPSDMSDLNALRPKDIRKIEYSRFTPARYADRGTSGLIEITLRKRSDGGQVYIWGRTAFNTVFVDGNVRASYHQGPSQFTLSYNPSWRNYQDVYDTESQSYIGDGFRVDLESHDRNPFYYHNHPMRLRYDYSPDSHTLFSATFSATPLFTKRRVLARTLDSMLGEYDTDNHNRSKSFAPSLDLFFRRDFNDRNTLEVQVVGTLSTDDYRRHNSYLYADGTDDTYTMNVDSRRRSLISEVSYIHTFSERTSLSAGYQNTVSHSRNEYLLSDYKPVLTENNNYAYVRLGQNIGPVFLSVSTGAKLFWIKNDLNRRHFIRNLSSAQLSWNINSAWTLRADFRYAPSIPSLSALTDYPQQITPYLVTNGNPGLKVAENFNYSLSVVYQHRKLTASFRTHYIDTKNSFASAVSYLGDGMFLSRTVNFRYDRLYQNDLAIGISDVHGFGANLYAAITNSRTALDGWSHSLTSFSANFYLWWTKGPVTLSYWRKIPGKYLNGTYVGKDENGDVLGVEYQPDKHWNLGLSWMYMFDKKGTRYPGWNYSPVNPLTRDRYISENSNMIVLSVTYNADFGSIFRTARRSLNNSDSSSSLLKL